MKIIRTHLKLKDKILVKQINLNKIAQLKMFLEDDPFKFILQININFMYQSPNK